MRRTKKKNKGHFIKKLFFIIILILNIGVAIPLLLSYFAQYTPPARSELITLCGLAFPYLLFANLLFSIVWLFLKYQYTLISLCLILINIHNIDRHYQLKAMEKPLKCINCVKVMSYNVKLFDLYNSNKEEFGKGKEQIFNYLKKEKPDIACFQEYFYEKGSKLDFNTTDSILAILDLKNDEKFYYQYFPSHSKNEYYYGIAIFSKYRIIDAGPVTMENNINNNAIFADIRYKGDTIRIYNIHLASLHMEQSDYETGKRFSQNIEDPEFNKNAKNILKKLNSAFLKRELQVKALYAHMDSCPHPIILCGDFNDTPASYSYNKLSKKLKDTFRESGKGKGYTYNGDAFPEYRIDYILYDKKYKAFGHTVSKEITVSDHYPIYSYISLQE